MITIWSLIPQWSVGPQREWEVTSSFEPLPVQMQAPASLFLPPTPSNVSFCLSHSVALVSATIFPCFSPLSLALSSFLSTSTFLCLSSLSVSLHGSVSFSFSLSITFFSLTCALPLSLSLPFPYSVSSKKPSKNLRLLSWLARTALFSS